MISKLRRFLLKRSILDPNSALESYEVDLYINTTGATARRPRRGGKSAEASREMLLFGFECDVKNDSLSQIFLTEPMLGIVTVVFGQN